MLTPPLDAYASILRVDADIPGVPLRGREDGCHDEQITKAFGIPKTKVEAYLRKVISQGDIVRNDLRPIGNRMGYERVYYYEDEYCIITGIGANGFIVSAYPHRHKKER